MTETKLWTTLQPQHLNKAIQNLKNNSCNRVNFFVFENKLYCYVNFTNESIIWMVLVMKRWVFSNYILLIENSLQEFTLQTFCLSVRLFISPLSPHFPPRVEMGRMMKNRNTNLPILGNFHDILKTWYLFPLYEVRNK